MGKPSGESVLPPTFSGPGWIFGWVDVSRQYKPGPQRRCMIDAGAVATPAGNPQQCVTNSVCCCNADRVPDGDPVCWLFFRLE